MQPTMNKRAFQLIPARGERHPLRLTALLYLREALLEERYEECATAIEIAREFGAQPIEIRLLLEDPRRQPRA